MPQSRGRLEKHSINDLEIKSPPSKKSKVSESNSTKQGINSTLYVADAHSRPDNENSNISKLLDSLKRSNPSLHFLEIVNTSCRKKCETKFGFKPEGSVLGVQMSLLPSSFKVYTSNIPANDISYVNKMPATYPKYPFTNTEMKMKTFIDNISDIRKLKLLESLKIDNETVNSIENQTKEQANCPEWFKQRKNRFTASICNKLNSVKTNRGLSTLAHNIVFERFTKKNNTLERKMDHGKFYEPIAISYYEKYFKSHGYDIKVEPCGLVIDEQNYALGASPDGKVSLNDSYGILEVKCSEEYKNVDQKDVCFISKNPCIRYWKNSK